MLLVLCCVVGVGVGVGVVFDVSCCVVGVLVEVSSCVVLWVCC